MKRPRAAGLHCANRWVSMGGRCARQSAPADASRRNGRAGIDLGLNRRCRRGEHDRDVGATRANHGHVAGVITHAVLLLVGRIVLLIDDDEAELGVGQE